MDQAMLYQRGRFNQNVAFSRNDHAILGGPTSHARPNAFRRYYTLDCNDSTDWVALYGTAADDTDHARSDTQSVKLTAGAGDATVNAYLTRTLSPAIDLSLVGKKPLVFVRFYVHAGSGASSHEYIQAVKFTIRSTSGNYWNGNLIYASALAPVCAGWYHCMMAPSQWAETGTLDLSAVAEIQLQIEATGEDYTPSVSLDTVQFFVPGDVGKVCITFDNGNYEHVQAARYMAKRGIPGGFAIITSKIGWSADYLTRENLKEIAWHHQVGHELYNHTKHHWDWNLAATGVADDVYEDDLVAGMNDLRSWGFGANADIFVMPSGGENMKWDQEERIWRHASLLRLNNCATDGGGGGAFYRAWPNIWNSAGPNTGDGSDTDTYMTTRYGYAKADKTIAIFQLHRLIAAGAMTKFETFIDLVAADRDAGDIEVVTLSDLRAY